MVYTNNVPQGNQQIATTQPIIQANFDYIQKAVGQEHNFVANDTDPTHTYHLQASMPNRADPVGLPVGTNGMYYFSAGLPKVFISGLGAQFLSFGATTSQVFNGTLTIAGTTTTNISPTINGTISGIILTYRDDGKYSFDTFVQNAAVTGSPITNSINSDSANAPFAVWNGTSLAIHNGTSSSHTFHFIGWFTASA